MTVSELIEELKKMPQHLDARIYLEPSMFPDEVDLNELPGWYRAASVEFANVGSGQGVSNIVEIRLEY